MAKPKEPKETFHLDRIDKLQGNYVENVKGNYIDENIKVPQIPIATNVTIHHANIDSLDKTSVLEESQLEAQIIPLTDIDNVVDEIAKKTNESKIQVLRKAMSLMKILIQAKEHGYKFGLTKDSKVLDSEISL